MCRRARTACGFPADADYIGAATGGGCDGGAADAAMIERAPSSARMPPSRPRTLPAPHPLTAGLATHAPIARIADTIMNLAAFRRNRQTAPAIEVPTVTNRNTPTPISAPPDAP